MGVPVVTSEHWSDWLRTAAVDPEIYELCPDYCAGLMLAVGIRSGPSDAASEAWLYKAEQSDSTLVAGQVDRWRDAYQSFGVKPRKARSSVDALTRRLDAGLPRINRITDTYNAVSVLYGVPIGVEDADLYVGRMRLALAAGDETFLTVGHGEAKEECPSAGEPIWRDDEGVTCRRWNWRQTTRTRVTESTENAVFIVDALGSNAVELVEQVLDELERALVETSDSGLNGADSPTVFRRVVRPILLGD